MSDDFVSSYLKFTEIYESSTSFWKWSAYAAIAAVLRDNCFRRLGEVHIYPNIYVLLLAESAVHRKGNPVNLCEKLVSKVNNTKVINGRTSIQAVLDELSKSEGDPKSGKIIKKGGSALFSAPELAAAIVADPEAIQILTDIYDFKAEYTSRLRSGSFKIQNVCFTMLAASNAELLKSVYDSGAIFGGLLGRTFLVRPNEFRESRSLFDVPDTSEQFEILVGKLVKISRLHGIFDIRPEAIKEYESWYFPFRKSYSKRPDKSGVSGRIHTSIVKLAMLIAANHLTLEVSKEYMEEAIDEAMALMPNYNQFVMSGGSSPIAEVGSLVLADLYEAVGHSLSRKEILRRHWQSFDSETLAKLIDTLGEAGFIEIGSNNKGEPLFTMSSKCLETLFGEGGKGKEMIQ